MKNITISFGIANTKSFTVADSTTVGQLKADSTIRAALGAGANIAVEKDGVLLRDEAPVADGDRLTFSSNSNTKAA